MSQGRLTALIVTYLVAFAVMWGWILAAGLEPRLGLDLQGGVSANLIPAEGQGTIDEEVLDQTVATIRERVDALGVAEPDVARQGDTIQVQLPGVADQEQARDIIGRTAQLQFRQVIEELPPAGFEGEQLDALPPTVTEIPTEGAVPTEGTLPAEGTTELDPGAVETEQQTGTEAPTEPAAAEPAATEAADPAATEPAATPTAIPTEGSDTDFGDPCDERADLTVPDPDEEVVLCLRGVDADGNELPRDQWFRLRLGPVEVSGADLTDARAELIPGGLGEVWQTALEFNREGAEDFQAITGRLACVQGPQRQLAIVLDNVVEQASPVAQDVLCEQGIPGGSAVIQARSEQQAKDLALVLRAGALPIQLDFGTFQSVSPTLGQDSLSAGLLAGLIGLALVAAYLMVLYRGIGLAAVLELVMFGGTVLGLIIVLGETIGFTLTLAGIAGVIVSIGIAADSSIIYRERYRDEVRAGRTIRTAADHAFTKAFRTNLTGNTVSLLAAAVLYLLAVGPVRGFAFTLGLSTIIDTILFATFTRGVFGLVARNPKLAESPAMGLRAGVTSEQLAAATATGRSRTSRKGRRK